MTETAILDMIDHLYDALDSRELPPHVAAEVDHLSDAGQLGTVLRRIAIARLRGMS